MTFGKWVQAAALVIAAALVSGATPRSNWDATVVETEGGQVCGCDVLHVGQRMPRPHRPWQARRTSQHPEDG